MERYRWVALFAFLAMFLPPPLAIQDVVAKQPDAAEGAALPDVVVGEVNAPITIIEYASMTCPHCAHFHDAVYPTLNDNYIRTGKVKFILREYPWDPLATAGFMLARCEADKRNAVIDLLFDQQRNWAFGDKPLDALRAVLKQTGMSKESFDACLKNQGLYDAVNAVRDNGANRLGVHATPTFFINGKEVTGEVTTQTLINTLEPLLDKKN